MKMQPFHIFIWSALFTTVFCMAVHAQQAPMNYFELASDARTKARTLADGGNYEAALAVLDSLGAGKYEFGDAAMQAAAAKIQGVYTDKARILIKLGRYDQADSTFYQAFDSNLAKAEKDLAEIREHRGEASTSPTHRELFGAAGVSARGALSRAQELVGLRESYYLLAGAAAKPFDPARAAKYDALEKTIARASKL
jgi:tetratricopeptide (TPR) repeat protein